MHYPEANLLCRDSSKLSEFYAFLVTCASMHLQACIVVAYFSVKYFRLKDVSPKFVNYLYASILENYDLDSDCEGENNK